MEGVNKLFADGFQIVSNPRSHKRKKSTHFRLTERQPWELSLGFPSVEWELGPALLPAREKNPARGWSQLCFTFSMVHRLQVLFGLQPTIGGTAAGAPLCALRISRAPTAWGDLLFSCLVVNDVL